MANTLAAVGWISLTAFVVCQWIVLSALQLYELQGNKSLIMNDD